MVFVFVLYKTNRLKIMLSNIEESIIRYLSNSATKADLDQLSEWIEKSDNKEILKEYVEIHYSIFYSMNESNTQEVIDKLLSTIREEKRQVYQLKRRRKIYQYSAAALIAGIVMLTYVFNAQFFSKSNKELIVKNEPIEPGANKAVLTLADGSQVLLEKGKAFQKATINSNGEELVYEKNNTTKNKISYNYLTIPRGGQFFIKLSDGTKVWLNSETQLKYPVNFIKGKNRKVELVYGEAFFDVSSSKNHDGATFVVGNKSQDIEVLGTEFNVKAYTGESNVYTTLVEGKVVVNSGNDIHHLKPLEQLNFDLEKNTKTVKTIDVYNEISWKEGVFSFENKSLKDMMKVLTRWYDIDVVFKNKAIEKEEFIGVLRKSQDLQEILACIKDVGIIKEYKIYGKKVIIE